jgi:hypothetical protein
MSISINDKKSDISIIYYKETSLEHIDLLLSAV